MKDAINAGKIRATNLGPAGANRHNVVTREQLRALAGMRGERPRFSFKEAR
jgi:hypothetical protein